MTTKDQQQERSIECPCCGVFRMRPIPPRISRVPWGDCACSDEETCMRHRYGSLDDLPPRPTDAALAEKGQQIYVERLKEHMSMVSRFYWVQNKLREVQ